MLNRKINLNLVPNLAKRRDVGEKFAENPTSKIFTIKEKKMKRYVSIFIINLIALVLFIISFSTIYYNLKYLDKSDIVIGKVSRVSLITSQGKGKVLEGFEYEINNIKDKLYLTQFETLNYSINVGDKIVSKNLHIGNTNSKILFLNGKEINNYYGIFDFLMLVLVFAIILSYFLYFRIMIKKKYKNRTEEYTLIYNRKNNGGK